MGIAASAASRSRLRWSCCSAPRPMVRPSVAALGWTGALIWDGNLGFGAGAVQEFRLFDEPDADGLGLVGLRGAVGPHHQARRIFWVVAGDVAPGWSSESGRHEH